MDMIGLSGDFISNSGFCIFFFFSTCFMVIRFSLQALTDLPEHDWEVILLNNKETCLKFGTVLIEKGKQNTKLIKLMRGSLEVLLGTIGLRI